MNIDICKCCECCWCFEKNNLKYPLCGYKFFCIEPHEIVIAPYGKEDFPFYFIRRKDFLQLKKYITREKVDYPYTDLVFHLSTDIKTSAELKRMMKNIEVNTLCRYYLEQQLFDWNKNEY